MKDTVNLEIDAVDQLEELIHRVETLEFQLQQVFERNHRVESKKRWEVGNTRTLIIALLTFICTASIFSLIGVKHFLLSALIPTTGYLLSTLSVAYFRRSKTDTKTSLKVVAQDSD